MLGRLWVIIKSGLNGLLGKGERPGPILDLAYEEFTNDLVRVKQGVADVATAKHSILQQIKRAEQEITRLETDAEAELQNSNDDLALRLLERKAEAQIRLGEFQVELDELEKQQAALEQNAQRLEDQIKTFGRQKEVRKAQYRSAEAQVKVSESLTGINRTGASVNRALGRIEEKTEQMQARATAIPELIAHGTLTDITSGGKDRLELEAEQSRVKRESNRELEAMKARLGLPSGERKQIEKESSSA